MHNPIFIKDIGLSFGNTVCFEGFSSTIHPGDRIAIIGRNGSGKSSLLKILSQQLTPTGGEIILPHKLRTGYVKQTIHDYPSLSGGERLNKKLSQALNQSPDLLLLDEPTNHLDAANRQSLMRMLSKYPGTLIIATHDTELLESCTHKLWHILPPAPGYNPEIHEFVGSYSHYIQETQQKRTALERELATLKRNQNAKHNELMKEQERASKSKRKGQKSIDQRKWPTVTSKAKAMRAARTAGKNKSTIAKSKNQLTEQITSINLPEIITPKFSLPHNDTARGSILSISNGSVDYGKGVILDNINLSMHSCSRIAICGSNAAGKTTLLKAIMGNSQVARRGDWHVPESKSIGYLDQHYANLDPKLSAIEHLQAVRPNWHNSDIRKHLNDFLFRKNEDVHNLTANLSGGEKARLSLCLIAAKPPKLLILDEVTNNLDLETKGHVTQVVQAYPGAVIIVSHEERFIRAANIDNAYSIINGSLCNTDI